MNITKAKTKADSAPLGRAIVCACARTLRLCDSCWGAAAGIAHADPGAGRFCAALLAALSATGQPSETPVNQLRSK